MVRRSSYDRNGLKKGTWSQEEDDILRAYVQRHGHCNWLKLPRFAGLSRSGKSCRLRWMNYLRPNVKRGNYTKEEDEVIIKLHEELGNKWCIIASNLPGRTDNEIKNHWHTKLKKQVKPRNTTASSEEEKDESIETSKFKPNKNKEVEHKTDVFVDHASLNILESSQVSLELPYHSSTSSSSLSSNAHAHSSGENLAAVDSTVASSDIFSELLSGDFWSEPFLADNNQYDFSPTILGEGPFTFPYISFDDDMVDYFCL